MRIIISIYKDISMNWSINILHGIKFQDNIRKIVHIYIYIFFFLYIWGNPHGPYLTLKRSAPGLLSNCCRRTNLGVVTTPLNVIPWAVVQVRGGPATFSTWRPLWPPRAARNLTRVRSAYRFPLCPLLWEHYFFTIGADREEHLSIASTTDEGPKLSPIASHRTWRGISHAGQNSSVCWAVTSPSPQWWQVFVTFLPMFRRYLSFR